MNYCLYCQKNETLHELMLHIADLSVSSVFLFKEQSYKGRCVVAYKKHDVELRDLDDSDLLAFMKEVNKVASAIDANFHPAKINYGMYSDKLKHLHVHLVPKYEDGLDYGGTFQMNPKAVYLSEEAYSEIIEKMKKNL
ncbi:HIT family protein [Bacteroidia bacterium]|nr:HIT family protein [Bacteroidia bacterium]